MHRVYLYGLDSVTKKGKKFHLRELKRRKINYNTKTKNYEEGC